MKPRKMAMKRSAVSIVTSICLILLIVGIDDLQAEEERPSTSLDVAVLSQYIWRGQELSRDSIVIQPSMTVGYKGLSMNIWGNLDTDQYDSEKGDNDWTETDLTLSYGKEFGMLSVEGGYIYYALEGTDADTQEVYLGFGLDTVLSPSLKIYRDIAKYPSWYFVLGLSHPIEINEKVSLELSGSVSYLLSDDEDDYPEIDGSGEPTDDEFDNFHDGVISANLPITLTKYITITPTASYCFPLSDDASDEMEWRSQRGEDDNFIYGGVVMSMAF